MRKTVKLALVCMVAASSCVQAMSLSPNIYDRPMNYLGSYLSQRGGISLTASSPTVIQTIAESQGSGYWAVNARKGNAAGYISSAASGAPVGSVYDMLVDTQNRVVFVGDTTPVSTRVSTVIRYTSNGMLDTSFANGMGYLRIDANSGGADSASTIISDLTQQSYYVGSSGALNNAAVSQVTSAGALATGFGTNGIASVSGVGSIVGLGLQSTGNIVCLGVNSGGSDLAAVRITSTGAADSTFTLFSKTTAPKGIAIDSQNRVIIVAFDSADGYVYRLSVNGAADTTFASAGTFATTSVSALSGAIAAMNAVMVLPDDSIILAGGTTGNQMLVVKLTSAGVLDTTFGNGLGYLAFSVMTGGTYQDTAAYSLASLPSGGIVAAGSVTKTAGSVSYSAVAVLTSAGILDPRFTISGGNADGYAAGTFVVLTADTQPFVGVGYQSGSGSGIVAGSSLVVVSSYPYAAFFTDAGLTP